MLLRQKWTPSHPIMTAPHFPSCPPRLRCHRSDHPSHSSAFQDSPPSEPARVRKHASSANVAGSYVRIEVQQMMRHSRLSFGIK